MAADVLQVHGSDAARPRRAKRAQLVRGAAATDDDARRLDSAVETDSAVAPMLVVIREGRAVVPEQRG